MSAEKVLIVEDEENERTGLAELVSGWGYRAETARDGVEGLEKVTSWSPAIVVSDLKMPRMGGMELLEKIEAAAQTIAVIVVTAQGSIDSAVEAMRRGAYDYITKPIDTGRLRAILQNASERYRDKVDKEVMRRALREAGSLGSLVGGLFGGFVAALLAIPAAGALQVLVREVWQATAPPPGEPPDPLSEPDDPAAAPGELFPVPPDTREHGS